MKTTIMVCLMLAVLVIPAYGQQTVISPALDEQLEELEYFVSVARGLDELAPVDRQFPTRAEVIVFLTAEIEEQLPPDLLAQQVAFYRAFDLIEPGVDPLAAYLELLGAQVGGFYDPETKEMNTLLLTGDELGDELPLLEQITYVHEFQHALQDQHFDLLSYGLDDPTVDPDQLLAILALIEGDASHVMNLFTVELVEANPFAAVRLVTEGAQAGVLTLPPDTPEILTRELLFPYVTGEQFVIALRQEGDWAAVDDAFENPPVSSEQIMHPEKYLMGEGPQDVSLGDTSTALDDNYTLLWERTLGEFYLQTYLRTQLDRFSAGIAASGWGGDRLQIYADGETYAWLLRIAWDTPTDADEFAATWLSFADMRYASTADTSNCWANSVDAMCVAIPVGDSGDSVIAYAPTVEEALRLLATQS